jgi:2-alkyl-3-oxoalkanoate reductase
MTNGGGPWRVGFVGAGLISEFHARALSRVPGATLAAVYDTRTDRTEEFAKRWVTPVVCSTLDALWREGLDVVHVLTPPSTHAALVIGALEHGCHVFVEKPLAETVADCDRITEAARAAARAVAVGHSLLRDPTVTRMFQSVRSGAIGDVIGLEYLRSQPASGAPPGAPSPWLTEGGFPFRDVGVHGVYLMEALLGPIRHVAVHIGSVARHRSVLCDDWHVVAECAQGTGRLYLSYAVEPWQSVVTVFGTRGILRADLFAATIAVRRRRRLPSPIARVVNTVTEATALLTQSATAVARMGTGRVRQYHGVQSSVTAFYKDLAGGGETMVTPAQARGTVEWTERIASEGDRRGSAFLDRFPAAPTAKTLVTGATGLFGQLLLARLLEDADRVRVLVRRDPPQAWWHDNRVELVFGDLGDPAAVDRAVAGTTTVFHLGAATQGTAADFDRATIDGTRHVVQSVLDHRVPRLVHVSSLAVLHLGACEGDQIIDEQWPLEPAAASRGHYTRSKLAAERIVSEAVQSRGLPAIILRPGTIVGIQGPGVTAAIAQRFGRTLIVIGDGELRVPLIAADDLVDAIMRAATRGPFDGTVLHLVDPAVVTQNTLVRHFLARAPGRWRVLHVPGAAVKTVVALLESASQTVGIHLPLTRYRIASALAPKNFRSNRAAEVLGWSPRAGVARTLGLEPADRAAAARLEGDPVGS